MAPASRTIVSPAAAVLMAACRSPPVGTTKVAAKEAEADSIRIETIVNALKIPGRKQRRGAAKTRQLNIVTPLNDCGNWVALVIFFLSTKACREQTRSTLH